MKFNFDNFLSSSFTDIKRVHIIEEGYGMVRSEPASRSIFIGHQYHEVKWWAILYRNSQQELLIFLKNPRSIWDCEAWSKYHKFFRETLEILKGE